MADSVDTVIVSRCAGVVNDLVIDIVESGRMVVKRGGIVEFEGTVAEYRALLEVEPALLEAESPALYTSARIWRESFDDCTHTNEYVDRATHRREAMTARAKRSRR